MGLLNLYRYRVEFYTSPLDYSTFFDEQPIAQGQFSEVSGLEASMDAHTIAEGGLNWGEHQRVGKTTFSTLVLKRGMTADRSLWEWFEGVADGAYTYRLTAYVTMLPAFEDPKKDNDLLTWEFDNCLPIKIKAADLSSSSSEIGIEELHLNHEGMRFAWGAS